MTSIKFRQFQDQDLDKVWELHISGLNQTQSFIPNPELDADLDNIQAHYLNNNGEFLIAEINNQIVGMGAFRKIDTNTAEIKRMRVNPDFQGQGIGKQILELLIQKAKSSNYKKLILDTSSKQLAAQNLYQKFSFKEYKRIQTNDYQTIYFELEL